MYVLFILCVMPSLLSGNNQTFERRRYVNAEFDWNSHSTLNSTRYTQLRVAARVISCKYIRSIRFGKSLGDSREFDLPIELPRADRQLYR